MSRLHLGLALLWIGACQAPGFSPAPPSPESDAIEASLDELYEAFCFDPGQPADWDGMRALFAKGAAFVGPFEPGTSPKGVGAERFLADFQDWVSDTPIGETGLHERILATRIDHFGGVAHAWVTFEGFVPGTGEVQTLGVDSLQLVLDGEQWKVASFTTQYTRDDLPLPARFGR